ncbi:1136_t:CDS:2 [Ambispora gerdemannii]|uniref:1136_t:CDS:1 n=1 Tax=Ambispora gerdemannii TaxID=144530 RepID=A0A9N8ZXX7_9GLOM|nr:1136_t:CDS:2 [Ambispora gerdemannii]
MNWESMDLSAQEIDNTDNIYQIAIGERDITCGARPQENDRKFLIKERSEPFPRDLNGDLDGLRGNEPVTHQTRLKPDPSEATLSKLPEDDRYEFHEVTSEDLLDVEDIEYFAERSISPVSSCVCRPFWVRRLDVGRSWLHF